jgi:hypothetical protein
MMIDRQHRGLWSLACDRPKCLASFEINGYWDITPSKDNTIRAARQRKWYVGKSAQFCPQHRPKGAVAQYRDSEVLLPQRAKG